MGRAIEPYVSSAYSIAWLFPFESAVKECNRRFYGERNPPFYGSVSRGGACIHLRFAHQTNFGDLARREPSLILASLEVSNIKALFEEYRAPGVEFAQQLVRQAWGGIDFHVRDLDGNVISFVQYRNSRSPTDEAST